MPLTFNRKHLNLFNTLHAMEDVKLLATLLFLSICTPFMASAFGQQINHSSNTTLTTNKEERSSKCTMASLFCYLYNSSIFFNTFLSLIIKINFIDSFIAVFDCPIRQYRLHGDKFLQWNMLHCSRVYESWGNSIRELRFWFRCLLRW